MADIELPKPYPAQEELLSRVKRNNLLILARRWGKTTLTSRVLKHSALTIPNYRAAFSAPTWKLMMETFEQYKNSLKPAIARVNREDRRIELVNKSVIEFWSSDDVSAGRGRRYNLWVSDESQRQRDLAKFIRGSVRPTLADFRGTVYVLGTANGDGSELHQFYLESKEDPAWFVAHGKLDENPYIDPEEIAQMRRDLGPELAAQELDSLWVRVDGVAPLIRKAQWAAMYSEEDSLNARKMLAIDASISGDLTAVVAAWKKDDTYYVDYEDIKLIEPDPFTGEIDFIALEELLFRMWTTGKYIGIAYDPYQMVSLVQRLKAKGVRCFEFTQNSMRLKADGYLRQVLNQGLLRHPDHELLTEHMQNATIKFSSAETMRIVKPGKAIKIDLAVALSMAVYMLSTTQAGNFQTYTPAVNNQITKLVLPQSAQYNPYSAQQYNPYRIADRYPKLFPKRDDHE